MSETHTVVVEIMAATEVAKALERLAAMPGGRDLVSHSAVLLKNMGSTMRALLTHQWGSVVAAAQTADEAAALMRQAGVAEAEIPHYLDAWQAGRVVLMVRDVPPAVAPMLHAVLLNRLVQTNGEESAPRINGGTGTSGGGTVVNSGTGDGIAAINKDPSGYRDAYLPPMVVPTTGGGEEEGAIRIPQPTPGDGTSSPRTLPADSNTGANAAPPPAVQRYASVQAPAQVDPQATFAITVQLTIEKRAFDTAATVVDRLVATHVGGQATGAPPLKIQIRANGFDILGSTGATLEIPAERDSDPAVFQLRAKPGMSGPQEVKLVFYQGTDMLARRILTIQVGAATGTSAGDDPDNAGLALPPPQSGNVPDADLILYIERDTEKGEQLLFSYLWPQKGIMDLTELDQMPLNNVQGWAQQRYEALSKAARFLMPPGPTGQAAAQAAQREIEKIGENLYFTLPAKVRQFYAEFAHEVKTLLIYSTEPWIPWELVKPFNTGDGLVPDLCDFWCARFTLARWLLTDNLRRAPRDVAVRELCAVVPSVGLQAAIVESQYLNNLPQTWPPLALYGSVPRTKDEVLRAMESGEINVFHIATHGNFQAGTGQGGAIQLGTSQLTTDDLVGSDLVAGLTKAAPLIFLNACHSNRQDLALSGIGGWVERLIPFGASAFIGTNWEVQDDLAAQFAEKFYDGLRAGLTFGEACRQARLAIRQANPGNSTWLAYVLYAHPNGKLQVGAAHP